jgi:hypothetical protein
MLHDGIKRVQSSPLEYISPICRFISIPMCPLPHGRMVDEMLTLGLFAVLCPPRLLSACQSCLLRLLIDPAGKTGSQLSVSVCTSLAHSSILVEKFPQICDISIYINALPHRKRHQSISSFLVGKILFITQVPKLSNSPSTSATLSIPSA